MSTRSSNTCARVWFESRWSTSELKSVVRERMVSGSVSDQIRPPKTANRTLSYRSAMSVAAARASLELTSAATEP
jgi:hypothetical protein